MVMVSRAKTAQPIEMLFFWGERADSSEPREPCFRWSWLFIPFIDSNDYSIGFFVVCV